MDCICDHCGRSFPHADRVAVCRPRPSDPSTLVAVLWYCPPCAPRTFSLSTSGATGTPAWLDEQFECGFAAAYGFAFLNA